MFGKVNILLVSIVNRNLGDTVIADSAEYIIKKSVPYCKRKDVRVIRYNIYTEDFEILKNADMIVFAGGGIVKYKQENFYQYCTDIINYAQEHDIPVFLNSVGVEGYDEQDERCLLLKNALNLPCVKGITIRDDIEGYLKNYFENKKIKVVKVVDSAVVAENVYEITPKTKSKTIGLGIIRDQIFPNYGIEEITKEHQIEFWVDLTKKIENAGYKWQFFTNGLYLDEEFAQEILEAMGLKGDERYLAPRVSQTKQLVELISGYDGIVAGRMHTNIIAYALKVPSIGFVWNDKVAFWGKRIGYEKRFMEWKEFKSEVAFELLMDAISKGVKKKIRIQMMELRLYWELHLFIRKNIPKNYSEQKNTKYPWAKKLVAVGLGGSQMQFINMNSLDVMQEKIKDGFRKFEVDVRLTSDQQLVCVNGWSDSTLQKYALEKTETNPTFEQFMNSKAYGVYKPCVIEDVFKVIKAKEKTTLFVDIGRPSKEEVEVMVEKFAGLLAGQQELAKRIIFRVQKKYDVSCFLERKDVIFKLAYYLPEREKWEEKGISLENTVKYCKKNKISYVTMSNKVYDKEIAEFFNQQKIKVLLFTINKYSEMLDALALGADLVGTQHLQIKVLNALTEKDEVQKRIGNS